MFSLQDFFVGDLPSSGPTGASWGLFTVSRATRGADTGSKKLVRTISYNHARFRGLANSLVAHGLVKPCRGIV